MLHRPAPKKPEGGKLKIVRPEISGPSMSSSHSAFSSSESTVFTKRATSSLTSRLMNQPSFTIFLPSLPDLPRNPIEPLSRYSAPPMDNITTGLASMNLSSLPDISSSVERESKLFSLPTEEKREAKSSSTSSILTVVMDQPVADYDSGLAYADALLAAPYAGYRPREPERYSYITISDDDTPDLGSGSQSSVAPLSVEPLSVEPHVSMDETEDCDPYGTIKMGSNCCRIGLR